MKWLVDYVLHSCCVLFCVLLICSVVDNSTGMMFALDMPSVFLYQGFTILALRYPSDTRSRESNHGSHTPWSITKFSVIRNAFPMWCTAYYWSPDIEFSYPGLYMPEWVSIKRFMGVSFSDTLERNSRKLVPLSHVPSHGFIIPSL